MSRLKFYIQATRPRTLLLALSSVFMGVTLPFADYETYQLNPWLVVLLLFTALFLQILSNVSNELGDFRAGIDEAEDRVGPRYTLALGNLQEKDFKVMIGIYATLAALCGLAAIYLAFGTFFSLGSFVFLLGGFVALKSAVSYTLGMDPYGRRGLGDFYVFLFFGIVAVVGSYQMCTGILPGWHILLPALAAGCFNVAVLNINNIRDIDADKLCRNTIPVRIGDKKARFYHLALILCGWFAMLAYSFILASKYGIHSIYNYMYVLSLPLFIYSLIKTMRTDRHRLDACLPLTVLSTALFCLLAGVGYCFMNASLAGLV